MIEAIRRYVLGELNLIAQAPVSMILALGVVTAMVWKVLAWRYQGIVDGLKDRLQLRDDRITEYELKLNGASPDDAKARIEALEASVAAIKGRRLTSLESEKLRLQLSADPGIALIGFALAASDAKKIHDDLVACFSDAGWTVRTYWSMERHWPASGVKFLVFDKHQMSSRQTAVLESLRSIGLDPEVHQLEPHPAVTPNGEVSMIVSSGAARSSS